MATFEVTVKTVNSGRVSRSTVYELEDATAALKWFKLTACSAKMQFGAWIVSTAANAKAQVILTTYNREKTIFFSDTTKATEFFQVCCYTKLAIGRMSKNLRDKVLAIFH